MKKNFDVIINRSWCKACGLCYWICPTHALVEGDLKYPKVIKERCIGCLMCENVCPELAIDVVEVEKEVKREV